MSLGRVPHRQTLDVASLVPLAMVDRRLQHADEAGLKRLAGWRNVNSTTPVANFQAEINRAAGIEPGGRKTASVDQLRTAAGIRRLAQIHGRRKTN